MRKLSVSKNLQWRNCLLYNIDSADKAQFGLGLVSPFEKEGSMAIRFTVHVTLKNDTTWMVHVQGNELDLSREIHRHAVGGLPGGLQAFPQPLAGELPVPEDQSDYYYRLCTSKEPRPFSEVYRNISRRDPGENQITAFGHYLHSALLGHKIWMAILEAARGQPFIELALSWTNNQNSPTDTTEQDLTALPWEMMHDGKYFLAERDEPKVAITRLVQGVGGPVSNLPLPLRVLFVVGSGLDDVAIQSGAEYLGLLRRLSGTQVLTPGAIATGQNPTLAVGLNPHVLLRATRQDVEAEVKHFQPSVVHFICHGTSDGFLKLSSRDPNGDPEKYNATGLLEILKHIDLGNGTEGYPPVVVLNACYSGAPSVVQLGAPLAMQIVSRAEGRAPVVLGMAGQVADRACRLFTWRFYDALLNGQSVVEAAAQGRRSGIVGANPATIVDWAMPALFIGENTPTQLQVAMRDQALNRECLFTRFPHFEDPPVFCGRQKFLFAYRKLTTAPSGVPLRLGVRALVQPSDSNIKYGKTRLLYEIAAFAIRDGHLPCLYPRTPNVDQYPDTALKLGWAILDPIRATRKDVIWCQLDRGLPAESLLDKEPADGYELEKVVEVIQNNADPAVLTEDCRVVLKRDRTRNPNSTTPSVDIIIQALQIDFRNFAEEARTKLNAPKLKVLLLLDDVDRFPASTGGIISSNIIEKGDLSYIGSENPKREANPVPIIFTFYYSKVTASDRSGDRSSDRYRNVTASDRSSDRYRNVTASDRFDTVDISRPSLGIFSTQSETLAGTVLDLERFDSPDEERLAYTHFLLGLQPPLALKRHQSGDMTEAETVLDDLKGVVEGIPSRLKKGASEGVEVAIRINKRHRYLEDADTDDQLVMEQVGGQTRASQSVDR